MNLLSMLIVPFVVRFKLQEVIQASRLDISGATNKSKMEALICWNFHRNGWMKCNKDRSVIQGRKVGCGVVFRDESRAWILGFVRCLGDTNIMMVELLGGLLPVLEIAW